MATNRLISIGFKIEDAGKDGFQRLVMDANALRKAMNSAVKESEKLKTSFINVAAISHSFKGLQESVSQLEGGLRSLTSESESFASAMKAANTMAGKDSDDFARMKKDVTALSKEVPVLREELAGGLYQVISNGVPEKNWISFLETSARSSVGGMADLGTAVTVTSTIIKNYGLEWDKAREIQDKVQLTAKNGETSFEQLAASLPKVTGNAATLGVGIDELMASFATLTGVSGNTSEVATQLSAIFTSLVKPSSEAGKMAEAMGIQFDAAAIKAAGGFRSFIEQLKKDVASYAQASGTLEQEIYGKLFGSAEAVRALIPLTGELSSTFTKNVDAMKGSAGTMDAAFAEMASTGEAKTLLLKNKFAELGDMLSGLFADWLPHITAISGALSAALNIGTLYKAMQSFHIGAKLAAAGSAALSLGLKALGVSSGSTAVGVRVMTHAFKGGAASALALKVAIRGLMVATGVGVAIWLLIEAVSALVGATGDSTDAILKEAQAYDVKKRAAEMATETAEAESETRAKVSAQLSLDIARLKEFKGSKEEEKRLVGELNTSYGQTMGYFKSVSSWYEALVKNSKAYCDQMVAEAKARKFADQIAELEINRDKILRDDQGKARKYSTARERITRDVTDENGKKTGKWEYAWSESDLDKATRQAKEFSAQIEYLKKQMGLAAKESAAIVMPMIGSKEAPVVAASSVGSAPKAKHTKNGEPAAPAGSIADINDRLGDIRKKIEYSTDPDEIYRLERERMALQDKLKDLEMPVKLASSGKDIAERMGKIEPLRLDVEVNMDGVEEGLQSIPETLSPAEKLQQDLGNIAGAAQSASQAFRGMGEAFEAPALDIMGMLAGAIATMIQGYATATSQASSMGPWGWLAFGMTGLAQLMAMVSQVKNISKFADGGIVSGPTMALVGEYAGASGNPEVIAPLDKLQKLIGTAGGGATVVIPDVRIKGGDLLLSFRNQRRIDTLSGGRRTGL